MIGLIFWSESLLVLRSGEFCSVKSQVRECVSYGLYLVDLGCKQLPFSNKNQAEEIKFLIFQWKNQVMLSVIIFDPTLKRMQSHLTSRCLWSCSCTSLKLFKCLVGLTLDGDLLISKSLPHNITYGRNYTISRKPKSHENIVSKIILRALIDKSTNRFPAKSNY